MNADPQDARGWYRLGNQREDEGRDEEARACFERAVALDPAHARAWNNLGAARQRLGDPAGAVAAYRRALGSDPALLQPNLNLGRLHEARGELAEAAACYRAALAHHPGDERLAHLLAAASGQNPARAPQGYVQALFDDEAPRFESHLVRDLGYAVPSRLAELLGPVLAARPRPAMVLDLGCGTGLVGAALAGLGCQITGVDLSSGMLREAARGGAYARLVQGDVHDTLAGAPPRSLDAVVAADVFIYIGALEAVFREVARALVAGGAFAFSVESIAEGDPAAPQGDYRLQPTGRYAHSEVYLRRLAGLCGLGIETIAPARIRRQGHGHAEGAVALLRKA